MLENKNTTEVEFGPFQLGQKLNDGGYHMGLSPTTHTSLSIFPENVINGVIYINAMNTNTAVTTLRKKSEKKERFRGHLFSEQQQEKEIITAYNEGREDGGLRLLTKAEWQHAGKVFEQKPELLVKVLRACPTSWVLSGSTDENGSTFCYDLHSADQAFSGAYFPNEHEDSVLCRRTDTVLVTYGYSNHGSITFVIHHSML